MSKILCIYHGKCADGFTAAWAVYAALGDKVEFHPGIYGEAPPDITDRDVLLVDFSYKRPVLEQMASFARFIMVMQHHKTSVEHFVRLTDVPVGSSGIKEEWQRSMMGDDTARRINALFDMNRSGAGIAWDFFHDAERPALVDYVEDRDLWRFKLPYSREVNAFIFSHDYTFDNWDQLANDLNFADTMATAEKAGAAIERKHHKDVTELVGVCKRRLKIGGVEVWGASIPYTYTSDAGNLMAQGEPFAACYWDTPRGRIFSLRSTADGADVSAIAAQYGGGGHKNASGFTVPLDQIAQFELS